MDTGADQSANALLAGVLPQLRYVFVTDGLLTHLRDDELSAVMAHEIGHARQHHLLIKAAAILLINGGTIAVLILLMRLLPHARSAASVVAVALPLVVFASLVFAQGAVGIALERRADDYAAATAGPGATLRMLEQLASINLLKKRTGRVWNLLQQHPGIEQRIERVRQSAVAAVGVGDGARAGRP